MSQRTKHGVRAAADAALQDEFLGVDVAALHVVDQEIGHVLTDAVGGLGWRRHGAGFIGLMREDDALDVFRTYLYIGHTNDFHRLRDAYGGTIPRGFNLIDVVHADELR